LTNSVGCDSIATLVLTVKSTSTSTTNVSVCSNQLPYSWNGTSYNAAGTYNKTFTNAVGCDSIATLILSITAFNPNLFAQDTIRACGSSYSLSASSGYSSYSWNTGTTTQSINVTSTGWYKCIVNNGTCTGADSVFVSIVDANIVNNDTTICRGGAITLSVFGNSSGFSTLPANLRNGLVAYYPFNGNANDESGNGNNAIINGALLSANRFGNSDKSYYFDGNSHITTPITLANNSISYVVWYKANSILSGHPGLVSSRDGFERLTGIGFLNNLLFFDLINGARTSATISNLYDNNWHNVIATFSGDTSALYYDGELKSKQQNSISGPIAPVNIMIGFDSLPNIDNRHWVGELDDVLIYNRSITPSEINQIVSQNNYKYQWSTGDTSLNISVSPTQNTTYYCTVSNGISSCTDSVTVYVKQQTSSTTNVSVCSNQLPYLWNGTSYSTAGTYNKTLVNAAGCDSITTLNLSIKSTSTSTTNISVCANQLPYIWNGISYNAAGTYIKLW
jgi:hypothetical protein